MKCFMCFSDLSFVSSARTLVFIEGKHGKLTIQLEWNRHYLHSSVEHHRGNARILCTLDLLQACHWTGLTGLW